MSRVAVKLAVVLASILFASGTLAAACTPFRAADDGGQAVDEGGAGDGTVPEGGAADGGAIVDGALTDVGRPCTPPSCTDFETGQWPASWSVHGSDSTALNVTTGAATSGAFALDLVFKDKEAFLAVDVAGASKVTITANVLVLAFGDGEVDFLGIAEAPATGASGLYLVHPMNDRESLAVELPANQAQLGLASSFKTYTPVRLELDLDALTYAYTVGSQSMKGTLAKPPSRNTLAVLIGGLYTAGATKPWHVRYDDVEIVIPPK